MKRLGPFSDVLNRDTLVATRDQWLLETEVLRVFDISTADLNTCLLSFARSHEKDYRYPLLVRAGLDRFATQCGTRLAAHLQDVHGLPVRYEARALIFSFPASDQK